MQAAIERVRELNVSEEISPDDQIFKRPGVERLYIQGGRTNLLTIFNILDIRRGYTNMEPEPRRILDFGSGHGRVARFLRAAYPEATVDVTDLNAGAVGWCVERFGCKAVEGELPIGEYDMVWAGSVFTHLPEPAAKALLRKLLRSLAPKGVLAITTHGRYRAAIMADFDWENDKLAWMHFHLGRERFEQLIAGYHATGYGYVDYANTPGYGMCVARAGWYSDRALATNGYTQILLQERADNRQDVSAFMRANITGNVRGPF